MSRPLLNYKVKGKEAGTNGDSGVSYVERRPMKFTDVKIYEIYHTPYA